MRHSAPPPAHATLPYRVLCGCKHGLHRVHAVRDAEPAGEGVTWAAERCVVERPSLVLITCRLTRLPFPIRAECPAPARCQMTAMKSESIFAMGTHLKRWGALPGSALGTGRMSNTCRWCFVFAKSPAHSTPNPATPTRAHPPRALARGGGFQHKPAPRASTAVRCCGRWPSRSPGSSGRSWSTQPL